MSNENNDNNKVDLFSALTPLKRGLKALYNDNRLQQGQNKCNENVSNA